MDTQLVNNSGGAITSRPAVWGHEEPVRQNERLTPKIHLMQGPSKLVAEEKAKMGDIVDLVEGTVLGGAAQPVEIIVVKQLPSTWVVYERDQAGQRQFKEIIPVDGSNERWEWQVKDGKGKVIRDNDYSINFLVLDAKTLSPFFIGFKRTSAKAGKKIINYLDRCKMDRLPAAARVLKLTSVKLMKDGKPYYVFDVLSDRRPTTEEEMDRAWACYQAFQNVELKVDHSDLKESEAAVDVESEERF